MNKKDRTIKAHRQLAEKYRSGEGEFFAIVSCSLCLIHASYGGRRNGCCGCPLANENGNTGCFYFKSYMRAYDTKTPESFDLRAQFHEKIIPILEKIPAERFTRKGWTYFNELDRSW